jgi:hypothetical protein
MGLSEAESASMNNIFRVICMKNHMSHGNFQIAFTNAASVCRFGRKFTLKLYYPEFYRVEGTDSFVIFIAF